MMTETTATIDPKEAAHFGTMAADWWDPKGSSAMLHKLNPVRLAYIRAAIDRHWDSDDHGFRPLGGKRALDVGCGAGLLAEPLARLGASVTGLDAAPENIAVAVAHAQGQGLAIDYRATPVEQVSDSGYDLVTSMEVIEHVADPAAFVRALAAKLAPDGLMILSTPNRTPMSRLAMITIGESIGGIPKGTHDWSKFITPDELTALLEDAGLEVTDSSGLAFDPARGFTLSANTAINYLLTARHKG
ncbi:bifunctional 2-polyprenyl-6-hydroxyphenol methylase/3-demethylubiquinol 3-O-methyltransferase UbiG [Sphingobium yanoikuyae]|jgi:2-polyprenyl-6-hydroxyphenyl methylase / 3-demethylubiquinone-9 3-methyltransferase|uniref:Ubiquinone biosynthesis O-methyltransferase n=1 Tax=Sphingobium yanoikuyae TaxID=13690 RepID=A0A6P1GI35_SPHYA|nr:bifunctional 2-polyprenyl-6-hydroxyphenol methylase/3-demethylubiquinol 3-O-methyltransferase UbiG [Sphingobium yanoikuyae]MBO9525022.1 bifunctional 2-polyprenyl-6-hydroxyphenol methylase/3-demethylubiquinol 3-O-methyltransferase UbiG [Sphingobium yanoikuyae]NBB40470.1 bifunctional 2-polyprenyl-6-hydroxyphenol methylase/3-demethylubiquinol 3-O-methyltransferase UbiG [Sphingobium yanoikuyae]QHD68109.1 bifunctional 2-polyprenyl-6-hydroxyphenol methylase/3-demethylubiquinol 3-O-methyltransferase